MNSLLSVRMLLAATLVGVIAAAGSCALWGSRCFEETTITSGQYLGLTIGAEKSDVFNEVLRLQDDGVISCFSGVDYHPSPVPSHYIWDSRSDEASLARLTLYSKWNFVGPDERLLGHAKFRDGHLVIVTVYDERGYLLEHATTWAPTGGAQALTRGLLPDDALDIVRGYLSRGILSRIETWEHYVAPPTSCGKSAFVALEPWDKWRLGVKDWGGLWLTFEDEKLVRVHHRVQCIELP